MSDKKNNETIEGKELKHVFAVDMDSNKIPGRFIELPTGDTVLFQPDIQHSTVVTVAGVGMNIWPYTVIMFHPESYAHVSQGQSISYEGSFGNFDPSAPKH